MTINSRRKGQTGEREACALLTEEFGLPVKLTRNITQTRDSGTDILGLPGFSIEVKRHKRFAVVYEALDQARTGIGAPAGMLRGDGKHWLVVMDFADWAKLAREAIVDEITS